MTRLDKQERINSALYRYVMIMASFFIGLGVASFIPLPILFMSGVQTAFMLFFFGNAYLYNKRAYKLADSLDTRDFFNTFGRYEFTLGFSIGLLFSAGLLGLELLAPGSIVAGMIGTACVWVAALTYYYLTITFGQSDNLNVMIRWGFGLSKTVLSVLVAGMFLEAVALYSGFFILGHTVELAVCAMFGIMMVGNIFTVLRDGCVVVDVSFWGNASMNQSVEKSPGVMAIEMGLNTIRMFVEMVQFLALSRSEDKAKQQAGMRALKNMIVPMLYLTFGVVLYRMFSDTMLDIQKKNADNPRDISGSSVTSTDRTAYSGRGQPPAYSADDPNPPELVVH